MNNDLVKHILSMADDAYLLGHPAWHSIVEEAKIIDKTIIGLSALKDKWNEAKLRAGDMRGIGGDNRFRLAKKFGISEAQIMFDTVAPKQGKVEIEASIEVGEKGFGSVYTFSDLVNEVNDAERLFTGEIIEIQLIKVKWNKRGTDADRSNIGEYFIYRSK